MIQRNIHSSPAAFTIDRVVQCFRARSALLVSRLEDDDEVLHKTFSDSDDKDDAADDQSNNEYVPNSHTVGFWLTGPFLLSCSRLGYSSLCWCLQVNFWEFLWQVAAYVLNC